MSGGVDSAVSTALVHTAIGDQLTAVFVDHGLLRKGEREQVERDYVASTGVRLITVDAAEHVPRPPRRGDAIRRRSARSSVASSFACSRRRRARSSKRRRRPARRSVPVQGTLYPDVVESGGGQRHREHQVVTTTSVGSPGAWSSTLIEPLRCLFKDEVRALGRELGLPKAIVGRQPFPGPGLGIRMIGKVTPESLEIPARSRRDRPRGGIARRAGPRRSGSARSCSSPTCARWACGRRPHLRSSGRAAAGDQRGRDDRRLDPAARGRARKISNRITNEMSEVNRVVLDITSKPPATIEWE